MNPNVNLPAEVIQARQKASDLATNYGNLKAGEPAISDVLAQKVREAYADNQDVIKPLDTATATYYAAPAVAREKYQNIFNPFQRESLVSQYVSNESLPMLSYSSIYGNRMGRVEDTIGAGTRAYQAKVTAAQAIYEAARQNYQDLLGEYTTTQQFQRQADQDKLAKDKFDWDKKMDLARLNQSGGGTAGERLAATARNAMMADISAGVPLETIVKKYATVLDTYEIINSYNSGSPYGQAKEDMDTILNWTNPKFSKKEALTDASDDASKFVNAGASRDDAKAQLKLFYPELSEDEINGILYMSYGEETPASSSLNLNIPSLVDQYTSKLTQPVSLRSYLMP